MARLWVDVGIPTMFSSGDTSAPSHVYLRGIEAPCSNDGEETPNGCRSVVVVEAIVVVVLVVGVD